MKHLIIAAFLIGGSGGKPKTQTEEVVTSIASAIPLPVGRHTLLLVHHNVVDGQIKRRRVGLTSAEANSIEGERKAAVEAKKQPIIRLEQLL